MGKIAEATGERARGTARRETSDGYFLPVGVRVGAIAPLNSHREKI